VPSKTVICRHCGDAFTPQYGKPGYIDECTHCLGELRAESSKPLPEATFAKSNQEYRYTFRPGEKFGLVLSLLVKVVFCLWVLVVVLYFGVSVLNGLVEWLNSSRTR